MKVIIVHEHKCKRVATAPAMGEGRDFWIGELLESIKEYPIETHCLHLNTQSKEITFLCNKADFQNLIVICQQIVGELNKGWMTFQIDRSKYMTEEIQKHQRPYLEPEQEMIESFKSHPPQKFDNTILRAVGQTEKE